MRRRRDEIGQGSDDDAEHEATREDEKRLTRHEGDHDEFLVPARRDHRGDDGAEAQNPVRVHRDNGEISQAAWNEPERSGERVLHPAVPRENALPSAARQNVHVLDDEHHHEDESRDDDRLPQNLYHAHRSPRVIPRGGSPA